MPKKIELFLCFVQGSPYDGRTAPQMTQVLRKARETGFNPDIITDMTPAHDPLSYVPEGLTVDEARELRREDRDKYFKLAGKSMIDHLTLMNEFHDKGVQVFEYGNSLRKESRDAGMAVDEALPVLDNFLDAAYMGNLPNARIIHGKGTGVLRAAVQEELRRCKYVKSFRLGVYGEGESGVTIVEFK